MGAERSVVRLQDQSPGSLAPDVPKYLNRLSDFLFTLARAVNEAPEELRPSSSAAAS
eukprot:NODE_12790_length_223_cov_24.258621_g11020_i0.p3 GENE.NODE_12790_length_223_cov_24.258621_g11020_i0~~NODE_12790_length_223_cov_24.258621_g11020_i0.p3  ORF type:complete len:66 (+),score=30.86 NODE_12790_length_223_cov_24.258621_g11020_i0:29-199(+)